MPISLKQGNRPTSDLLHRPPDPGERQDFAGLIVGLVIDLNVAADETVKVEQTNRHVGTVSLVEGFLGEAPSGDVETAVLRAYLAPSSDWSPSAAQGSRRMLLLSPIKLSAAVEYISNTVN